MSTELLDQSPLYREWVDKAKAEGLAGAEARRQTQALAEMDQGIKRPLQTLNQVRERLRQPKG